ncbi:MAG TPA: RNA-binding protein [Stellaceae bacterium]|nr:RNA-binding protein [Stellaceae bacterium]
MRSRTPRGNVFVANLPPDFDDERLAEIFDSFGIVLSAHVARDPASGKRLRYGFVDIATERAAERAVKEMNGVAIDGHQLDVRISERKAKVQPKKPAPQAPRPAADRPETPPPAGEIGQEAPPERGFGAAPPRRRQTRFVVERRPLPRRI